MKITGIKELDRKLRSLEPKVAKRALRRSLRDGLKPILARARDLAPEGPSRFLKSRGVFHAGGSMRKKIKIRATRSRKAIRLSILVGTGDYTGEQFYASFVEEGTSRQQAQHPMRRAFNELAESSRDIIINDLWEEVESVKGT